MKKNDGIIAALYLCGLIWFAVLAMKMPSFAESQLNVLTYIEGVRK